MFLELLVRTRELVTAMRKEKYFKRELNNVKNQCMKGMPYIIFIYLGESSKLAMSWGKAVLSQDYGLSMDAFTVLVSEKARTFQTQEAYWN